MKKCLLCGFVNDDDLAYECEMCSGNIFLQLCDICGFALDENGVCSNPECMSKQSEERNVRKVCPSCGAEIEYFTCIKCGYQLPRTLL